MAPENGPLVGRIILRDLGPLVSRQTKEADLVVEPEGLCFIFIFGSDIREYYHSILYMHMLESCPQFEAVISPGGAQPHADSIKSPGRVMYMLYPKS